MTLAFQLFTRLCDVANEFDRMRETFPQDSLADIILTAIVESLDQWIDLLIHTEGIAEIDEPKPGEPYGHHLCRH